MPPTIRKSNLEDIAIIHKWLQKEEERGIEGNFLCNHTTIQNAHNNDELFVYLDKISRDPIAYLCHKDYDPQILQVLSGFRNRGIGREMFEYCYSLAYSANKCIIKIQCAPDTSVPFWRKMGFYIERSHNHMTYGYCVIKKIIELPKEGNDVYAVISFYPRSKEWDSLVNPIDVFSISARRDHSGIVHLSQRIGIPGIEVDDVVVQLELDGDIIYKGKAKHEEAQQLGFKKCSNGYYIDIIHSN